MAKRREPRNFTDWWMLQSKMPYRTPEEIARMAWDAAIGVASRAVPYTWLDPLLSGDTSITVPANGPEIEKLLRGVKDRIAASTAEYAGWPSALPAVNNLDQGR